MVTKKGAEAPACQSWNSISTGFNTYLNLINLYPHTGADQGYPQRFTMWQRELVPSRGTENSIHILCTWPLMSWQILFSSWITQTPSWKQICQLGFLNLLLYPYSGSKLVHRLKDPTTTLSGPISHRHTHTYSMASPPFPFLSLFCSTWPKISLFNQKK